MSGCAEMHRARACLNAPLLIASEAISARPQRRSHPCHHGQGPGGPQAAHHMATRCASARFACPPRPPSRHSACAEGRVSMGTAPWVSHSEPSPPPPGCSRTSMECSMASTVITIGRGCAFQALDGGHEGGCRCAPGSQ